MTATKNATGRDAGHRADAGWPGTGQSQTDDGAERPAADLEADLRRPGAATETRLWAQAAELGERVKELDCLYGLSALVERPGITLPHILQGAVDLLPPAWQCPEMTAACLRLEDQIFQTVNYEQTQWQLASQIHVHGQPAGVLEVCYLEEMPEQDEGPFLAGERLLLEAIAERLGRIVERERAEASLLEANERLAATLEALPHFLFEVDREGRLAGFHARSPGQLYPPTKEHLSRPVTELLPEAAASAVSQAIVQAIGTGRSGAVLSLEVEGRLLWFELSLAAKGDPEAPDTRFLALVHEITERVETEQALQRARDELEQRVQERTAALEKEIVERQRAQEELRRSHRALKVLGECQKAVSRASHEEDLLRRVCEIIVAVGGYVLAWVGHVEGDGSRAVRPVARAGSDAANLDELEITWADTEKGRGPIGTAIRTGRTTVARDIPSDPAFAPWWDDTARLGYRSSLILPVEIEGRGLSVLCVGASEPDAFDGQEAELLSELADGLAQGLGTLRTRCQQERVERELARSDFFLSALNKVSARVQTTFEPWGVLETLGAELEKLGLTSAVALLEPEGDVLVLQYTSIGADTVRRAEALTGASLAGACIPLASWLGMGGAGFPDAAFVPKNWSAARDLAPAASDPELERVLHALGLAPDEPVIHVPMVVEGRLTGVLSVTGPGLQESDIQALSTLANQVAVVFERARLAQNLAEARVSREYDRLRSELIANVSHEIRTPLGLIEVYCSSLQMDDVALDAETVQQFLGGIREETSRLEGIVDNLLDQSRLEDGRLRQDKRPTDLGRLAAEVVATMEFQSTGHGFAIDFPATPLVAAVDARQVVQVLRNLLSNAVRYSPHGQEIRVQGSQAGGEAILCVSDRGIGIAKDEQERIFERFYRVEDNTTHPRNGVGLGLSVSRGIVEAHGGRMWVESARGEGSCFCFTLPMEEKGAMVPDSARLRTGAGPLPAIAS